MGCCAQCAQLIRRKRLLYEESNQAEDFYSKKKLVMIGLESSGKTSILKQLKDNVFEDEQLPTFGLNVETIMYQNKEYLIFDCGGKYENVDGIIFVIDSTNNKNVKQVRNEYLKLNFEKILKETPILTFLNKQDLKDELINEQELIDQCGVNEMLDLDVIVQKCSAKTGQGVIEGFQKLANFLNNEKRNNQIITCSQKEINSALSQKSIHITSFLQQISTNT